jgi:hypothetical protein
MTRALTAATLLLIGLSGSARAQAPGGTTPVVGSPFQPPGLLVTPERVAHVLQALPTSPELAAAHGRLMHEAQGYLGWIPDPIYGALKVPGFYTSQRAVQREINRRLRGDAYAAHCLALAHTFGAGPNHARRAKEILFAWVGALTHPEDGPFELLNPRGDTPIVISYGFPNFIYAYDLLRGAGQLTPAEEQRFTAWLRPFVTYMRVPDPFLNNHHNWRVLFLLCSAHALEDQRLFDRAVALHRDHLGAQIAPDGCMWLELIRGKKAATYSLMALEAMIQTVVIAERHGYAGLRDHGGLLRSAVERLHRFVVDPDSWRRYRWLTRTWPLNGPSAPSDWGWAFEAPAVWWGSARYQGTLASSYGLRPPRAYTLSYARLLFRPIPGLSTPGAP